MSLRPHDRAARQAAGHDLRQRRHVRRDAQAPLQRRRASTRKPVTTSSKIRIVAGLARQVRVAPTGNAGRIGILPKVAPVGSRMTRGDVLVVVEDPRDALRRRSDRTAARCRRRRPPRRWLPCRRNDWCGRWSCGRSSRGSGHGSAPASIARCTARASRSAISVASVPEEVKRTRSADGTIWVTSSAQRTSSSWQAPKCVPRSSAACTARITVWMVVAQDQRAMAAEIIDIVVAIDVPFHRPRRACVDIQRIRIEMPAVVRQSAWHEGSAPLPRARRSPGVIAS